MSNQIAELRPAGSLVATDGRMSAQQVLQHAMVVQEVMRAVMKPEVHYGSIPGTDKPTLFQPGADKLCMTFRIAPEFDIEDLSTADFVRYRVTCRGVHQLSGVTLGSCVGEASSNEEKYKWRRAVTDEEFDATPAAFRRVKYGKKWNTKQVRTEPADVANTVLKMAEKRAKIGMVLNVTAASDMFGQDLEDLDAALRESLVDGEGAPAAAPAPQAPATWPADKFAEQLPRWTRAVAEGLKTTDEILAFALGKGQLTAEQRAQIEALKPAAQPPAAATGDPDTDEFAAAYDAAAGGAQ